MSDPARNLDSDLSNPSSALDIIDGIVSRQEARDVLDALGIRHDFPAALMKAKPESWFVDEYKLGAGDERARIRATVEARLAEYPKHEHCAACGGAEVQLRWMLDIIENEDSDE